MNSLPAKARVYIGIVYLSAVLSVAVTLFYASPIMTGMLWASAIFTVLAIIAGSKKISLSKGSGGVGAMSMSLGFTVTFAALLYCGPTAGMMVGVISCVAAGLRGNRQKPHQLLFNSSLSAVETFLSGSVYYWLCGRQAHDPFAALPALLGACLVFYLVNTIGVAIIIALCTDENPVQLWRTSFSWTAPSYFAGASISAVAIYFCGSHVLYFVLLLLPVVYLTYQSYTTYRARAEEHQQHLAEMQERQTQLADLYLSTIKSLALAIDAKDQYTHQHILRVQRYAVATGVQMGLDGNELEGLTTGALLHDIGKLGVPEYVLLKPGRLSDEEFAQIKRHPEIGAAILGPVEFPWPVLPVVKHHHEKWDGTGYPDGLAGENIPLTARILAVADVYDALTSSRSYRGAWDHARAIKVIEEGINSHFDPVVVAAFLVVIDKVVAELAGEEQVKREALLQETGADGVGNADKSGSDGSLAPTVVRELQQSSSELWALYEVAQSLSANLGLDDTLNILARKLEAAAPAGSACVFLLLEDDALRSHCAVGINASFFRESRSLNSTSLSLRVAQEGQSFRGAYDMDDLLIVSSHSSQWEQILSALIVPIVYEGEVLGTINMYHPQADAFTDDDRRLLEVISRRGAMAIYNARGFDRVQGDAAIDELTGCYTLWHLTHTVDELIASGEPFSLIYFDIDDFRAINDNFGRHKADEVLRGFGELLNAAVRGSDTIARLSEDEFVIIARGADEINAAQIAESVRSVIAMFDPGLSHGELGSLRISASVGWSCSPSEALDCASLLAAANAHMLKYKTERKLRRHVEDSDAGNILRLPEPGTRNDDLPGLEIRKAA